MVRVRHILMTQHMGAMLKVVSRMVTAKALLSLSLPHPLSGCTDGRVFMFSSTMVLHGFPSNHGTSPFDRLVGKSVIYPVIFILRSRAIEVQ